MLLKCDTTAPRLALNYLGSSRVRTQKPLHFHRRCLSARQAENTNLCLDIERSTDHCNWCGFSRTTSLKLETPQCVELHCSTTSIVNRGMFDVLSDKSSLIWQSAHLSFNWFHFANDVKQIVFLVQTVKKMDSLRIQVVALVNNSNSWYRVWSPHTEPRVVQLAKSFSVRLVVIVVVVVVVLVVFGRLVGWSIGRLVGYCCCRFVEVDGQSKQNTAIPKRPCMKIPTTAHTFRLTIESQIAQRCVVLSLASSSRHNEVKSHVVMFHVGRTPKNTRSRMSSACRQLLSKLRPFCNRKD